MGLSITVGILSEILGYDPESADGVMKDFSALNRALSERGLPTHVEPKDCDIGSWEGWGYSGLHALREVAGFVWQGSPLPLDRAIDGAADTPHAEALFQSLLPHLEDKKSVWARMFKKDTAPPTLPFAHLVVHGDANGFYVPQDFPVPFSPAGPEAETEYLWPVGSVQRLRDELVQLASALAIPIELSSSDDQLMELLDGGEANENAPLWQVHLTATYSCLILREACAHSLSTGAAIYFH
jgi:hypothetical protein